MRVCICINDYCLVHTEQQKKVYPKSTGMLPFGSMETLSGFKIVTINGKQVTEREKTVCRIC